MSDWKTAEEWADEALTDVPGTKRGFNMLAKREDWNLSGPDKARKRKGRGGGWEYHVSCLPVAAQRDYARRTEVAQAQTALAERKTQEVAVIATKAEALSARRRRVMEARAAVLREVDRRVMVNGQPISKAIQELLAEASAGLCEPEMAKLLSVASDLQRAPVPSERSVYRWRAALAKGLSEGGEQHSTPTAVTALAPGVRRVKRPVMEKYPWLPLFLRHWAKPTGPTLAHALDRYRDDETRIGDVPSYDQVRRAIKSLKGTADYQLEFKGREGPLAIKARSAYVSRSVDDLDPGSIYTSDGKLFDAEVQHPKHNKPFRPELTPVLDVKTRKIVGWSIGLAENADDVAVSLVHSARTNGVPAIYYVDRGPGFKNKRISMTASSLCARMGTTVTHSLPFNSQARGAMERAHKTIWNRLAQEYPSNISAEMDPDAAKAVFKASRKALQIIEGKRAVEDPETLIKAQRTYSKLIISWDQFKDDVAAAVEEYNNTPHSFLRIRDPETGRMRKASPNEVWAQHEASGWEPFRIEEREVADLYRPYEKRKTNRALIEFNTNKYFSQALEAWHGMHVFVGYDMHDAQRLWVREIDQVDGEDAPGKLICVAEYAGNEAHYMPRSMIQKAAETRAKGRQRRLEDKMAEVEAELRPQLEHQQVVEITPIERVPEPLHQPIEDAVVVDLLPSQPRDRDMRNPTNDPDIALAWQIVDAPVGSPIAPNHVGLMWEVLTNRAAVQLMKDLQLPLGELESRLEAAAMPKKSSTGG